MMKYKVSDVTLEWNTMFRLFAIFTDCVIILQAHLILLNVNPLPPPPPPLLPPPPAPRPARGGTDPA